MMRSMKDRQPWTARLVSLLLWMVVGCVCQTTLASIVVIGNANARLQTLTQDQLKNIYLGKPTHLSTGEHLRPLNQPDNASIYAAFYQDLLHWEPSQVSSYWSSLVFDGETSQPATVPNDQAAIAAVEQTPGAIAYVDANAASAASARVKVLYAFDGEHPSSHTMNASPHHSGTQAEAFATVPGSSIPAPQASVLSPAAIVAQKTVDAINAALHHPHAHPQFQPQASSQANTTVSLWPILIGHFRLGDESHQGAVRRQIRWYLSHKAFLQHMLSNAVPYLEYVYQQTRVHHVPAEFALLPMIESGYNPFAYSKVGATGLWQMMPDTASSMGLEINWWYDARRDTVPSTQSALRYLSKLHQHFKDWLLTAAAYNAGMGTVQAARQNNRYQGGAQTFWQLSLPQETEHYVPKLLALASIVRHASRYGVRLPYIANRPYFSVVELKSQMDLKQIARLVGVSINMIRELNPGMRRWATRPGGTYALLIPANRVSTFQRRLAQVQGKKYISWAYHQVRSGENLTSIAKNYRTSQALLKRVNGLKYSQLSAEQGLLVPLHLHHTYNTAMVNFGQYVHRPPVMRVLAKYSALRVDHTASANDKPARTAATPASTTTWPANSDKALRYLLQKIYH